MTQEEKTEALRKDIVAKYSAYKDGTLSLEAWTDYLIGLLTNYIKALISEHHFTAKAEYDDLLNAGRIGIWLHTKEYDPVTYGTMPTSFFKNHILESMREVVKQENGNKEITGHYQANIYKLNKCAQENGYEGIDDPNLTSAILSEISGVSMVTVEAAKKLTGYVAVSLSAVTENFDSGRHYGEPERQYIEKERSEKLIDEWNKLNKLEQFILRHTKMSEEYTSEDDDEYAPKFRDPQTKRIAVRNLVTMLRTPEAREEFGDLLPKNPLKIDSDFIVDTMNNAIKRFLQSYAMQPYIQIKEPMSFCDTDLESNYEQASAQDIIRSMENIGDESDEYKIAEAFS